MPVADFAGLFDFEDPISDQFSSQQLAISPALGARKINIDEINSRQDQILIDLDLLDKKISDIIELWTATDQVAAEPGVEQAA